ncbi:MAG: Mur ligase family protein [Bacillota bacterium]|nr:Mur ligase family protein [Bacillota bacterium]
MEIQELKAFDFPNIFSLREPIVSAKAIIEEAKKRNIPVSLINEGELIRLGHGKYQKLISAAMNEGASSISVDFASDKQLTKRIFGAESIPIPYGDARQNVEEALEASDEIAYPIVIKPENGNNGKLSILEENADHDNRIRFKPNLRVKRNDASSILDMLFPEDQPFSVPIVSITGTNGKTTTTRMISRIIKNAGYTVGTTTTHGIYVNDKCLEEGDTTGPLSARRALYHKEIDAAVLETARGGIIRAGLAYEKADVAVFTNLSEDHLGIDDINSMEDLLNVKSIVVEAVKDEGFCILNADDPWVMKTRERAKGNHVLISLDESNPILIDHINNLRCAVYKKENSIFVTNGGIDLELVKINHIPATLNGNLKHNIYNSMAAIGACFSLNISLDIIRDTLKTFSCNADINPGRFNVYNMGDFKVVLDYGHNIEGYSVTIDGLKSLKPSRLTGIIGVPGDRRDKDIKKIGRIAGISFDKIIIKEDLELRGRKQFEVARILLSGALEGNIDKNNISVIQNEVEALKEAALNAKSGEVIVVFFEKMEPLVEFLNNFSEQENNLKLSEEPISV